MSLLIRDQSTLGEVSANLLDLYMDFYSRKIEKSSSDKQRLSEYSRINRVKLVNLKITTEVLLKTVKTYSGSYHGSQQSDQGKKYMYPKNLVGQSI
jgi:hypothetical protein